MHLSRTLAGTAASVAAATALIGLAPTADAAPSPYAVSDVGVGGSVVGVNDRGDLLVYPPDPSDPAYLVPEGGAPIVLQGTLQVDQWVEPTAINRFGTSVGWVHDRLGTGTAAEAVRWSSTGAPKPLARPAGVPRTADAPKPVDINDSGVIVGNTVDPGGNPLVVEWTTPTTPKVVLRGNSAGVFAINNRGVLAGQVGGHAVLVDNYGTVHPLGRLKGEMSSKAVDVNESGVAIGYTTTANGTVPVLWDASGAVQRLAGPATGVVAINASGSIVGSVSTFSGDGFVRRAFVRSAAGVVTFLPSVPGGFNPYARAINNRGVVGGATVFGEAEATIWTPTA